MGRVLPLLKHKQSPLQSVQLLACEEPERKFSFKISRTNHKYNILNIIIILTRREGVVPPIGTTEVRFQVVGSASDDHQRWRNEGAYHQEDGEHGHYHAQTLQQVHVGDFHRFGGTDAEDDRNPAGGIVGNRISEVHGRRVARLHIVIRF